MVLKPLNALFASIVSELIFRAPAFSDPLCNSFYLYATYILVTPLFSWVYSSGPSHLFSLFFLERFLCELVLVFLIVFNSINL